MGKRPGLTAPVPDGIYLDSYLFGDLAGYRMFKGLACFHKPGDDTIDYREKVRCSCQQDRVIPANADNYRRVDDRIEYMATGGADRCDLILFSVRFHPTDPA